MRAALALASAVAAVAVLAAPAPAALAGETDAFRFEPHPVTVQGAERRTFAYDLPAGRSVNDAVRVANKTDAARRFRLYTVDVTEDPATGEVTVPGAEVPVQGVGAWIELDQRELTVAPRASEVVGFRIARPAGEEARGAAAIVAEEVRDPSAAGGIDVVFRIAILVRVGGEVTGVTADRPVVAAPVTLVPSDATVTTTVTNATLAPAAVTVGFTVESLTGRSWPLEVVEVEVPPGASVPVTAAWDTVPRWGGAVRATTDVTWAGGSVSAVGGRTAVLPLWLLACVIVLIAARAGRELVARWTHARRGAVAAGGAPADTTASPGYR